MDVATKWTSFELIDAGGREKLEKWGDFILRRPDPQAIWNKNPNVIKQWDNPDFFYHRSEKGGGYWEKRKNLLQGNKLIAKEEPEWNIGYNALKFKIKPTGFKHTGLFPEQAVNWEWIILKVNEYIQNKKTAPKILNLFAYTGGATVAALSAGAEVVHVDASKGMNEWAKQNVMLSNLVDAKVRFIQDDVLKFVQREFRRGNKYDAIIMDPPVYGRGSNGQLWEIEKDLAELIAECKKILSSTPLFFLINAYANEFSSFALKNILQSNFQQQFKNFTSGELGLKAVSNGYILPCGIFSRAE